MADLEGKILNQLIHQIAPENIQQTHFKIKKIGLTEYEKIFLPRHRPKIKVDNLNEQILNLFVRKKWIDSFEVDASKSEYYKVQRSSNSKSNL